MRSWLLAILLIVVTECNGNFLHDALVEAHYSDGSIVTVLTDESGKATVPDDAIFVYVNKILAPPPVSGVVNFQSCFLCLPLIRG
jgi:hypothetical protein